MPFNAELTKSDIRSMMTIWNRHVAAAARTNPAAVDMRTSYLRAFCAVIDVVDPRLSEMLSQLPPDRIERLTAHRSYWTFDRFRLDVSILVPEGVQPAVSPPTQWSSKIPLECDLCEAPIGGEFYDSHTTLGIAACLCPECFPVFGTGLGVGQGQRYLRATDGEFYCIVGEYGPESEED